MKILLPLLLILSFSVLAAPEDKRYIVKFMDDPATNMMSMSKSDRRARRVATISAHGSSVLRDLDTVNAAAVRLNAASLAQLRSNPEIEYIEEDAPRYPMAQSIPYGIIQVQADLLSDVGAGATTVCIIDSGYDITHPDLGANLTTGTSDPGTGNWFFDGSSHGTHVAGTIAALNNSIGVVGTLPSGNINLHIVKVFADDGIWAYSSDLINAINVCETAGAKVVNMSLGGGAPSVAERQGMDNATASGLLLVAAAGNDGNTALSYPASYASVMSVAAVDENKVHATFSQRNNQVEISGPGVGVLSTIPMQISVLTATIEHCDVSGCTTNTAEAFEDGIQGTASGPLVDCGMGTSVCVGASGNVCLVERGVVAFSDKALNCQAGGGIGAIIYNNVPGAINGTLGGVAVSIPVAGANQAMGTDLLAQVGSGFDVTVDVSAASSPDGNYAYFDGTSMATPHVVGGAALLWSNFPECTNAEIRNAINMTAEDLGTPGRDTSYGNGLLQVKKASDRIAAEGCGGAASPIVAIGRVLNNRIQMRWTGSTGPQVEIHANGVKRATIQDVGQLSTSATPWAGQTIEAEVCNVGGVVCSNIVTLSVP